MNKQHVTLLVLLDLSAAFDTVDHCTLLQRLQSSLGLQGKVISWLSSYLSGRSQQILVNGTLSKSFDLECGVRQGSCLGPLLFTIYTSKLFEIIKDHQMSIITQTIVRSTFPSACDKTNQTIALDNMETALHKRYSLMDAKRQAEGPNSWSLVRRSNWQRWTLVSPHVRESMKVLDSGS